MKKPDLGAQLKALRYVAAPVVCVTSPDLIATERKIRDVFESGKTSIPMFRWDAMNGVAPLTEVAEAHMLKTLGEKRDKWPAMTANPGAMLAYVADVPGEQGGVEITQRGSFVFVHNAQRFLEDAPGRNIGQFIQGVQNVREPFKGNRRMLVLLVNDIKLPPELVQDVVMLDDPYPTDDELAAIVAEQVKNAGLKPLKKPALEGAVDALRGMSAYAAEQTVAMSLTEQGLDLDMLWIRAVGIINQTDALTVDEGDESFDVVRGLANIREFSDLLVNSKRPPSVFLRIDEMDKNLGGIGANGGLGDNTGTSQDRYGVFLKTMEDNRWVGLIALGHAGTGKTLLTKALAAAASKASGRRVLSIAMDLGATEQKELGESGKKVRAALKVVNSRARGRVCVVATCNEIANFPAPLKRRFTLGTWMFDLPDAEERAAMWKLMLDVYEVADRDLPDDTNWTGSDIRNVCATASNLGIPLKKALQFTTLVAKSDPEAIERLRRVADGKFISASQPGIYQAPREGFASVAFGTPAPTRRVGKED